MSRQSSEKTEKNPYRFIRLKFFILTFLITLMVLCLVGLPFLLASGGSGSSSSSKPEEYAPDWSDKLSLLMEVKDEEGNPLVFFLLGLHPVEERIYLTPMPLQTWLSAGQKENTLSGFSDYGGIYLAAEAITQSCGVVVERTAAISIDRLVDLVNRLGGIQWESPEEKTASTLSGETLTFASGLQKLDGERFAALLVSGESNQSRQLKQGGELVTALLNQHLAPRVSGEGDRFAEISNFFVTDFSYSDYLNRADALDAVSANTGCASLEMVSGSYTMGNSRFILSEEGLALLQKRYPK